MTFLLFVAPCQASSRLAHLMIAPQLDIFALAPEWRRLTADAPDLVAWLARMNERPSFKATIWERFAAMAQAA